jgi:putative ABC transport system ATP-binding protein
MVTHDRRLVAYCDRLLVMEDGVLREEEISTFQQ